ncbi:hypothetical protein [Agrococcus terreus]|uniref:Uncharacterized protein n=1 Tax=Agrococcus terreus TaxID=574649 RepID=A0ABQ2KRG5_9MICO|nr:hypothetical protein [Agrococcus terreus]GGN89153.1 hypothetical protein GCM10010968_25520 [Agrococcus terreus]
MTQYDGPVFVQPEEAGDDAEVAVPPRVRPVIATAALCVALLHAGFYVLRLSGVPGAFVDWDPTRMTPVMEAWTTIISMGTLSTAPVAVVLALVALSRKEDGRVRIGVALGAGGMSIAWFATMSLAWAIRDAM